MGRQNPWIVNGIIHEACTLLFAREKVGKTLLAVDLGHALMTREGKWLGQEVVGGPYNVAFAVSDPKAEYETSRRLAALQTPATIVFRARRNMSTAQWTWVAEKLTDEYHVNFLFVDSGSNLVGNVNDPSDVGNLMDGLNVVLDTGITVVLIHHISASNDSAGIYEWRSWPRQLVKMTKDGDMRKLAFDGAEIADIDTPLPVRMPDRTRPASRFRLVDRNVKEELRTVERLTKEDERIAKMKARSDWGSQREIAESLGIGQSTVHHTLKRNGYELRKGSVVPKLEVAA